MNRNPMIYGFAGKGGVGKSTSSVSYAFSRVAKDKKVLIVDYDGGHSVPRVLGMNNITPNKIDNFHGNLGVSVIDPTEFTGILKFKEMIALGQANIKDYLNQFEGHQGVLAFYDMLFNFFGVLGDNDSISKFGHLVEVYKLAQNEGYDEIIFDVEPTAGLERLLSSTSSFTSSMDNLYNTGFVTLNLLASKWKEIGAFMKGDYIKQVPNYMPEIEMVSNALRGGHFYGVCVPEFSPVDEMLDDVTPIIERAGAQIAGYVVNKVPENPDDLQLAEIERVKNASENFGGKIITCPLQSDLNNRDLELRLNALQETSKSF